MLTVKYIITKTEDIINNIDYPPSNIAAINMRKLDKVFTFINNYNSKCLVNPVNISIYPQNTNSYQSSSVQYITFFDEKSLVGIYANRRLFNLDEYLEAKLNKLEKYKIEKLYFLLC